MLLWPLAVRGEADYTSASQRDAASTDERRASREPSAGMGRSRAEYSLPKKTRGILSEAAGSSGSTPVANPGQALRAQFAARLHRIFFRHRL